MSLVYIFETKNKLSQRNLSSSRLIWTFAHVVYQFGFGNKPFIAYTTSKWPFPRMVSHMNSNGVGLSKSLRTYWTLVRFFFGMRPYMMR